MTQPVVSEFTLELFYLCGNVRGNATAPALLRLAQPISSRKGRPKVHWEWFVET